MDAEKGVFKRFRGPNPNQLSGVKTWKKAALKIQK